MGPEFFLPQKEADNTTFQALITEKIVEKNIKEMSKSSVPGPDGIMLAHLVRMDLKYSLLMEIFNLWLVSETIPDTMRECQTILIPKSMDGYRLNDNNNRRPIMIASMVLRLFCRTLMARLTKVCPINPRQRGFICAAGGSENLKLLQLLVKQVKKEHKELGIVFVDITKAFDTICHQHIIMDLMQTG